VLNELELTILALVAEGPRCGADVEQLIDERELREWLLVGSSSAYYVLNKLEQQRLLSVSVGSSGQTIYELTEAGYGVLQTAVAHLLGQPRPQGTGVDLGLANLKVLKPAQVYQSLVQRRAALRQQLQTTEQLWERYQHEGRASDEKRAFYTHGIAMMTAELAWLEPFIADWQRRYPAVLPEYDSSENKATQIHHQTAPLKSAKMIQRLRPPGEAE
jgi:DNA-binding PadR family transcriptional regulator